ncbi:hypothetical protein ACWGJ9_12030 [Curtobacterium citreum]
MRRLTITAAIALTVAALTGCSTTAGPAVSPPATSTVKPTATASTPTPTATETAVADPKVADPSSPAAAPSASSDPSSVSALAQHIYNECSLGAAENGITLTFTERELTGYVNEAGHYQLVYPFTFNDGHDDPYAIYNCALTDDTVTSKFLAGGITDTH